MTMTEAVEKIENGNGLQVDKGSRWGRELCAALRENGWKSAKSYSKCSVASFEAHLEKGNKRLEITSACFMGAFTNVYVWEK